jgi:hypothetical protein
MAYDAAKANEVNQLIEQGLDPDEAILMAGISVDELGNYAYDPTTSQLGQQYGPPTAESVFDSTIASSNFLFKIPYNDSGSDVSLTNDDIDTIVLPDSDRLFMRDLARIIEAKIKAKNT